MRLSYEYTRVRLAALPEPVIQKFLVDYPPPSHRAPLTVDAVREIEAIMEQAVPGKGGLATQWALSSMSVGYGFYPGDPEFNLFPQMAAWYFAHYKTPLFSRVIQEYSKEWDKQINPKNILDTNRFDMRRIKGAYEEAERNAKVNQFPEQLPYGSSLYYDDGQHKIVDVTDVESACAFGKGTKWCTAEEGHAESYLDRGPLFVIYRNNEKIAQLFLGDEHTPGDVELKNLKNRSWSPDPEIRQVLIESGLMERALETLAQGGFGSKDAIRKFIGTQDIPELREICANNPFLAYFYATDVIGGPFPGGEEEIAQELTLTVRYAEDILKGRFLLGEENLSGWNAEDYILMLRRVNMQDYEEFLAENYNLAKRFLEEPL